MAYLIAAGIVAVFLALWLGVDALYRKKGFKNRPAPPGACHDCRCGGADRCVNDDPEKQDDRR